VVDRQPLTAGHFQAMGIETELVQDRGMDVGHIVPILNRMKAELIGGSVHCAALDAAAGHPDGEGEGMVVASVGALRARRAAKLGGEDYECFIEQPATIEVGKQAANRLVNRLGELLMVGLQSAVGIQAPAPPPPCWI
jgi:hypothetical protein